jgi:hypothetical protein
MQAWPGMPVLSVWQRAVFCPVLRALVACSAASWRATPLGLLT